MPRRYPLRQQDGPGDLQVGATRRLHPRRLGITYTEDLAQGLIQGGRVLARGSLKQGPVDVEEQEHADIVASLASRL